MSEYVNPLQQAAHEMMSEARSLSAHIKAVDIIRAQKLEELKILDTPAEAVFDDIVVVTAKACNFPMAVLTMIGADTAYIKASHNGGPVGVQVRSESFCEVTVEDAALTIIPDAKHDPRVSWKPAAASGEVTFYAGMPLITDDGITIGALCVCDSVHREFDDSDRILLEALARVAARLIQDRVK